MSDYIKKYIKNAILQHKNALSFGLLSYLRIITQKALILIEKKSSADFKEL
jgi:hypothetical protein